MARPRPLRSRRCSCYERRRRDLEIAELAFRASPLIPPVLEGRDVAAIFEPLQRLDDRARHRTRPEKSQQSRTSLLRRPFPAFISQSMLKTAQSEHAGRPFTFIQGDATTLPLADSVFDSVFMLGGIHHVADRRALFAEIARILKPGGRFAFSASRSVISRCGGGSGL